MIPSAPDSQRRQHSRLPIRMSAEIHSDAGTATAVTRDLSEGGVGLEMSTALPEETAVTLGLFLVVDDVEEERMPPLWVKGRVAWSAESDTGRASAGVRFEVITPEQKRWMKQVLGHLTPPPLPR